MSIHPDNDQNIIPADWPQWSRSQPVFIRPLPGGLTNKNFLIKADNRQLVLRINSPISAALSLNRSAESQALQLADSAGLCAPIIHYDPQHQYLLSRYLHGNQWHINDPAALPRLAQLLRSIHQLPHTDTVLNIADKAASYWRSIDKNSIFVGQLLTLQDQVTALIESDTIKYGENCLCHNDLLAENLIQSEDGKLYAIDWEYAAMANPFYELAVIVEGHDLSKSQQKLLLSEYLCRPVDGNDWQRLFQWRVIYAYISVLWYAVQYSNGALKQISGDDIAKQIQAASAALSNATA
jgi:thiamine kinase